MKTRNLERASTRKEDTVGVKKFVQLQEEETIQYKKQVSISRMHQKWIWAGSIMKFCIHSSMRSPNATRSWFD